MRTLLAIAATLACTSGWAMTSLPNGTWTGSGTYHDDAGKTGSYTETIIILNNVVTASQVIAGKTTTSTTTVTFDANGFFKAKTTTSAEDPETPLLHHASAGFCSATECIAGSKRGGLGMTLSFSGKNLHEFGAVISLKKKIAWESDLTSATE